MNFTKIPNPNFFSMKKHLLFIILCCLFMSAYSQDCIIDKYKYIEPKKSIGFTKNTNVRFGNKEDGENMQKFMHQDFTLEFWVKPTWSETDKHWHHIFNYGEWDDDENSFIVAFEPDGSGFQLSVSDGNDHTSNDLRYKFNRDYYKNSFKNKWIHIVVTMDYGAEFNNKGTINLYVNGESKGGPKANFKLDKYTDVKNQTEIYLGNSSINGADQSFVGSMNNFRFWTKALSMQEIDYVKGKSFDNVASFDEMHKGLINNLLINTTISDKDNVYSYNTGLETIYTYEKNNSINPNYPPELLAPSIVTNLSVKQACDAITLTWDKGIFGGTSCIYRKDKGASDDDYEELCNTNGTTYSDTDVTAEGIYTYKVINVWHYWHYKYLFFGDKVTDFIVNSEPVIIENVATKMFKQVENFHFENSESSCSGEITVGWDKLDTSNKPDLTGYNIQYKFEGGEWSDNDYVENSGLESYTLLVKPENYGKDIIFRIDGAGDGCTNWVVTDEAGVSTNIQCEEPPVINHVGDNPFEISWIYTDPTNGGRATKFIVYRAVSHTDLPLNDNDFTELKVITGGDSRTFTDLTAESCLKYYYKVKAENNCGGSDNALSRSSSDRIKALNFKNIWEEVEASKGYFNNKVKLTWKVKDEYKSDVDYFEIYRKTKLETDADYVLVNTEDNGNATSWDDENATANCLYDYKIRAKAICLADNPYSDLVNVVGFRTNGGIVSGKVSFEGGNTVKDVKVKVDGKNDINKAAIDFQTKEDTQRVISEKTFKELNSLNKGKFTFEAWVFSQDEHGHILQSSDSKFIIYNSGSFLKVRILNQGKPVFIGFEPEIVLNQWNHFAITVKPDSLVCIYLNGDKLGEKKIKTEAWADDDSFFSLGQKFVGNIDELRLWNRVRTEEEIKRDYGRLLVGDEDGLVTYLHFDENNGDFAYDISNKDGVYNKNHFKKLNADVIWTEETPSEDQLQLLGITDKYGNYKISGIHFAGEGSNFTLTPMLGTHEFDPTNIDLHIGDYSLIQNNINFTDVSSFTVNGRVVYDTRGVFMPKDTLFNLKLEEFNTYYKNIDGTKYPKGEYWLDSKSGNLYTYASISSDNVNIYLDGKLVLGDDYIPLRTDSDGRFTMQVPIGKHSISVIKDKHEFLYNGRFPSQEGSAFEFQEDIIEPILFVDQTRVRLAGRVVGGLIEANKSLGFGAESLCIVTNDTISSINNIGVATIKLGYRPKEGNITNATTCSFTTNSLSGEYLKEILPLAYKINADGVFIDSNSSVKLLSVGEDLNLSDIPAPTKLSIDGVKDIAVYHFEKSFIYRSDPELYVLEQTSDESIKVGDKSFSTEGFEYPIYSQNTGYKISLQKQEIYINKDNPDAEQIFKVPFDDGIIDITNNLALFGTEILVADSEKKGHYWYSFKGGMPSISKDDGFLKTINIKLNQDGEKGIDATDLKTEGIVLGAVRNDNGSTFMTQAPDIPDIILRDPPGSNSFATIEKGESISFTSSYDFNHSYNLETDFKLMLGAKFEAGGGLAGPVIATETTNSVNGHFGISTTSSTGKELTKTYHFNQSISTSDDPDYVGADGDLYIGNSKNLYFQEIYDLRGIESVGDLELKNSKDEKVYLKVNSTFNMSEKASETFFIYSQKEIVESIIPKLEDFLSNYKEEKDSKLEDGTKVLGNTKAYYEEQIALWKGVIVENEKSKFKSKYRVDEYEKELKNIVADYKGEIDDQIKYGTTIFDQEGALRDRLNKSEEIENLLDEKFKENISFDAGVGEFSKGTETTIVKSSSLAYNLHLSEGITLETGWTLNKAGLINTTSAFFDQDVNKSVSKEEETTLNISYILKDNDPLNTLSVDVINPFDGNGPVFITKGGRTSCPYEGAETSLFYSEKEFDSYFNKRTGKVLDINAKETEIDDANAEQRTLQYKSHKTSDDYDRLEELKDEITRLECDKSILDSLLSDFDKEFRVNAQWGDIDKTYAAFSTATQKIEDPKISVVDATVSGVLESQKAEFEFILSNHNETETDGEFLLIVDNTTNQNNAIINIEQNGTVVNVPYGEEVKYTLTLEKSISDVYDYDNILISLQSLCDDDVKDTVSISAHFVPSCTEVFVTSPLNNWVGNKSTQGPVRINLGGFNTSFNSFHHVELQIRPVNSADWTRLKSYYGNQTFYDEALSEQKSNVELINAESVNYELDLVLFQDGGYELRAVSYCTNDTEYVSESVFGTIDLNSPVVFGTPSPSDGILNIGDDLKVQFNEEINFNSAISKIEVRGVPNQLELNHNVSLRFDGTENKAVLERPNFTSSDFSIEFWMKKAAGATGGIFIQESGLDIHLVANHLQFSFGGITVKSKSEIANDKLYHHYAFTYAKNEALLSIIEDDKLLKSGDQNKSETVFPYSEPLVIGGSTFVGNIHDIRIWNKTLSFSSVIVNMNQSLVGNEKNLIGYWPMDEGKGDLAKDKARFKHISLNTSWDILPKGSSYDFTQNDFLMLDNVSSVIITDDMDATISFWVKTNKNSLSTIFSNVEAETNHWRLDLNSEGELIFVSNQTALNLSNQSICDNQWHHVALSINKKAMIDTYIDNELVSSYPAKTIEAFGSGRIVVGARLLKDEKGVFKRDQFFTGKLDEFQIWKTQRSREQISGGMYNQIDINSIGLLLYLDMNDSGFNGEDVPVKTPKYYHQSTDSDIDFDFCNLESGMNYSDDVAPIRPKKQMESLNISHTINGDQFVINTNGVDWARYEGRTLDVSIGGVFDDANNEQQSPVTWSVFVNKDDMSWFAESYNDIIDIVKQNNEVKAFEITILNKGNISQTFTINNVPAWLNLSKESGVILPQNSLIIKATIDSGIAIGDYEEDLYLETDFGFDQKMPVKLKVLSQEPDWEVNPSDFTNSMNIVGKIKIDKIFSDDVYDKIVAMVGDEVRGVANLEYVDSYQSYYVYLSVYSNVDTGEDITFSIWDSSKGRVLSGLMEGEQKLNFEKGHVLGKLSSPAIFENSGDIIQEIFLNPGWTWVSFNVNDPRFSDMNLLTSDLYLTGGDQIQNQKSFDNYDTSSSDMSKWEWSNILKSESITTKEMYKFKIDKEQTLVLKGEPVNLNNWSFDIQKGWNWLPYPLSRNNSVNEALAYFNAKDGDVIKSQTKFSVYDPIHGWSGTLKNLERGQGYMLKSAESSEFSYPRYFSKSVEIKTSQDEVESNMVANFSSYENNMNAIFQLPKGYNQLFIYDESGELKGHGVNQSIDGKYLIFATIFGENSENLHFKLSDDGQKLVSVSKNMLFKANTLKGTIEDPIVFEMFKEKINIYPNPFIKSVTFEINSETEGLAKISWYSLSGTLVRLEQQYLYQGANTISITPNIKDGMYLVHIECNGVLFVGKVLKQ